MDIVYAVSTVYLGDGLTVRKGTHWSANDPVVRDNPDLFSSDPRFGLTYSPNHIPREMAYAPGEPIPDEESPVEQATAAPGERRNTRRSRGNADVEF